MRDFGNSLFNLAQDHYGVVLILLGVFLIVASIRDWKWLIEPEGTPSFGFLYWLNSFFGRRGYRIAIVVVAFVIILCGMVASYFRYW